MQEEEPLPPERDQEQSEPDTTPPDHHAWQPEPFIPPNHTHAPVARSDSSPNSAKILEDLAASKSGVDYAGVAEVEEIESNIQERSQRAPSRRSSIHAKSVVSSICCKIYENSNSHGSIAESRCSTDAVPGPKAPLTRHSTFLWKSGCYCL